MPKPFICSFGSVGLISAANGMSYAPQAFGELGVSIVIVFEGVIALKGRTTRFAPTIRDCLRRRFWSL
jgi:hypothetical protein